MSSINLKITSVKQYSIFSKYKIVLLIKMFVNDNFKIHTLMLVLINYFIKINSIEKT